jgi:hypothetical protein
MNKLFDNLKFLFSFRPVALTATTNGTGVDTQGYNDAVAVLEVGAVTGTSPTMTVKIQESDDNSTFSDVSGLTFTQVTASNSSQLLRISELNVTRKRYLRAVATIGGTTPSFTTSCELVLGDYISGAVNSD